MDQQQRKRRTSIMKKKGEVAPLEGGPNKSRRVSFSATVNMKLFRKDEAMASPPPHSTKRGKGKAQASPLRYPMVSEEQTQRRDKENIPPHQARSPISSSRPTPSLPYQTRLAMPLKLQNDSPVPLDPFRRNVHDDFLLAEEEEGEVTTMTTPLECTRRFLDESMDLTQPCSTTIEMAEEDVTLASVSSHPEAHPRPSGVGIPPPLLSSPSFSPATASTLLSPGDRTVVMEVPMDLTLPIPARLQANDRSIDGDDSRSSENLDDEEAAHTVFLDTTMDLTSALDCSVHRRRLSSLLPISEAREDDERDDCTTLTFPDTTQLIDQTMELTTTLPGGPVPSALVRPCDGSSTNDLSAELPAVTSTIASLQDALVIDKLREIITLTEIERKQSGCAELASLIEPVRSRVKELEEQLSSQTRSKVTPELSEAATKKAIAESRTLLQVWTNDLEQSFYASLVDHVRLLEHEYDELIARIERHKASTLEKLPMLRRRASECQDLVEITQGLSLWQLRAYTHEEASFLFRARAPLQPHLLNLQLGPFENDGHLPNSRPGDATRHSLPWYSAHTLASAVKQARFIALMSGQKQEGLSPFVLGLVKGTKVQDMLRQLTSTDQLRTILEELTFRLERVQLLLADIDRTHRLSPYIYVEGIPPEGSGSGCSLRLTFSLLERGCKFALQFHDLHYGFPYAELRWSLTRSFGDIDLSSITRLVDYHTAAPTHGLFTRLSRAILRASEKLPNAN